MELRGLRGMPVLTVDTGERLGEVADVLLDPQERQVKVMRVRRGGMWRGDMGEVSYNAVQSIGRDALMLPSRVVLRPAEGDHGNLFQIDQLIGLRVVSEYGEALGTVEDAELDPTTGRLTALVMVPSGLGGLLGKRRTIAIEQVRTIGRDVVVLVASPGAELTEEAARTPEQSLAHEAGETE